MSSRSRTSYGVAIASVSVLVLAGVGLPARLADQPAGGRGGDERLDP